VHAYAGTSVGVCCVPRNRDTRSKWFSADIQAEYLLGLFCSLLGLFCSDSPSLDHGVRDARSSYRIEYIMARWCVLRLGEGLAHPGRARMTIYVQVSRIRSGRYRQLEPYQAGLSSEVAR